MTANAVERTRRLDPIDLFVGKQIRQRRKRMGISQVQLAEKIGITFQQVQKYEKGINRIGAGRLFRIACILDVKITDFFPYSTEQALSSGVGEAMHIEKMPDILSTSEVVELSDAFERIPDPETRQRIVELAKSIANSAN